MHVSTDIPTNPQTGIVLFDRTREIEGREGEYIYKKKKVNILRTYGRGTEGGGHLNTAVGVDQRVRKLI
jgi:hypothetical protein